MGTEDLNTIPLRDERAAALEAVRKAGEERGRARGLTPAQRAAIERVVRMHAKDRREQRRPA